MPLETPKSNNSNRTSDIRLHGDFVQCQQFHFRLSDVDGFSHQTFPDGPAITIVNYKGYTQNIPDPDQRFYELLAKEFNSKLFQ